MNDLLYSDELSGELEQKLKNVFPDAQTEISWDEIHGQRLSIELPEHKRREYLKFIIKEGFGDISFCIQLTVNAPKFKIDQDSFKKNYEEVESIIKELENEKNL